MVALYTGHVCRGFLSSLQSATSSNARSCCRAIRSHNVRNFSRSSIAYAATTNYARPTTTAQTASTAAASKSSPIPAAFKSAAPAAKPSTTTATPKPATTKSTTETTQTDAPTSDTSKPRTVRSLAQGLADEPLPPAPSVDDTGNAVDWSSSFHGLSGAAFSQEAQDTLLEPISPSDVEIKPDGIIYLPEIKYRRILNKAFGPGAWGLAPRGETIVTPRTVTREYGLVVHGRLVSIARGEQQYFDPEGIPTASEGCKSNALMRCCKDLGIASELWDPVFIRMFMAKHSKEVWVEHMTTKKTKKIIMRKDVHKIPYPFKEKAP